MKKNLLLFNLIIFVVCILLSAGVYSENVYERPLKDQGPTKVRIFAGILNISDIDAVQQILNADVYLIAVWKDPRLAHNNPVNVIKPLKDIWNPSLTIVNRQNITSMLPDNAEIQPDGTVISKARYFGSFSQKLDYSDFPFDMHNFVIKLVSRDNGTDDVILTTDSIQQSVLSSELTILDWNITEMNNVSKEYAIAPGIRPIPSLSIEISAKRKSNYYIYSFILPLVFIILMSMSSFWLHRRLAAAQISVAVTSMLTLIAWRFSVSDSLPKLSYLTRMDILIFFSTVMIFLTILEVIVTAFLGYNNKEILADKIDLHSRWLFPLLYAVIFLYSLVF